MHEENKALRNIFANMNGLIEMMVDAQHQNPLYLPIHNCLLETATHLKGPDQASQFKAHMEELFVRLEEISNPKDFIRINSLINVQVEQALNNEGDHDEHARSTGVTAFFYTEYAKLYKKICDLKETFLEIEPVAEAEHLEEIESDDDLYDEAVARGDKNAILMVSEE